MITIAIEITIKHIDKMVVNIISGAPEAMAIGLGTVVVRGL